MHKTENILFFENVNNFRQLLKEYVSRGDLISAIDNNEVVQIRYEGNYTNARGWRTIEPFVLGNHADTGNMVLRAWQQAGDSDSMYSRGRMNFPKGGNDKYTIYDVKGTGPGWRLFRIDGIKEIRFTNKRFSPKEALSAGYKPNDSDMVSIIASAIPSDKPTINVDGKGIPVADTSIFDKQTQGFKMNVANKEMLIKNAIINANGYITKKAKERIGNWILVQLNDGRYITVRDNPTNQRKFENNIIGNLQELKDKYFGQTRTDFIKNKNEFKNKVLKSREMVA